MRHVLRLAWNRKRQNALILLEIFCCALVLIAVSTMAVLSWSNYRRPLGFEYENVWSVSVDLPFERGSRLAVEEEKRQRLLREIDSLGPVEAAAGCGCFPFESSSYTSFYSNDSRQVKDVDITFATPGLGEVLRIPIVRGRWFGPEDEALNWVPVIIDETLAEALFGSEDPIGRRIRPADPTIPAKERRVVGVIRNFRRGGDLSLPRPSAIEPAAGAILTLPRILVRVRPGTSALFEEELVKRLQGVERGGSFEVKPLSQVRESSIRSRLSMLLFGGIVAAFLLSMVTLGLVGVLWQNLIRRTREIGLRRAAGASRASLQGQLLAEQLVLTTFGIALAVLLAGQVPLTGFVRYLPPEVLAGGVAVATAILYLLTTLSALYPGWMASRIPPAEALRYE